MKRMTVGELRKAIEFMKDDDPIFLYADIADWRLHGLKVELTGFGCIPGCFLQIGLKARKEDCDR